MNDNNLIKAINSDFHRRIKAEQNKAIREFAKRLKNGIHEDIQSGCDCADYLTDDLPDIIDNLVKEMTEATP